MDPTFVVIQCARPDEFLPTHEGHAFRDIARRLAEAKGWSFADRHDPSRAYPGRVFFLPRDTLVASVAAELGIGSASQLLGGIVPHEFVMTKVITHPLVTPAARAPGGWSAGFSAAVQDVVLPGWTAFTADDAREGARRLFRIGPVRVKAPRAAGGRGQNVVRTPDELDRVLSTMTEPDLARHGVVLETNLTDVRTASVGQVTLDQTVLTYCGTQHETVDNHGRRVYGGSDLLCVRGGWEALDSLWLDEIDQTAIQQARTYDDASEKHYGVMVSRKNYDVASGRDARGAWRSGVLEQSWRVGGASAAEIAAMTAFLADPTLSLVRASSREAYGPAEACPADATVHFRGVDAAAGPVLRYSLVSPCPPERS